MAPKQASKSSTPAPAKRHHRSQRTESMRALERMRNRPRHIVIEDDASVPAAPSTRSLALVPSKPSVQVVLGLLAAILGLLEKFLSGTGFLASARIFSGMLEERLGEIAVVLEDAFVHLTEAKAPKEDMDLFNVWRNLILQNEDVVAAIKQRNREREASASSSKTEAEPSTGWVGKKEDDDERFYREFNAVKGLDLDDKFNSNVFLSQEHKRYYNQLSKRGALANRPVNFADLDNHGVLISELFQNLKLEAFLMDDGVIYPNLVAYFYSNLHGSDCNRVCFSANNEIYTLTASELAKIVGVDDSKFKAIPMSSDEAYAFLTKNPDFSRNPKKHVVSTTFPLRFQIVHRIVAHCLRPKTSSIQDVSQYEAKLTAAIIKGIPFSFPHTIILCMHRAERKKSGALPYGSLITRIFQHFNIKIPDMLVGRITPSVSLSSGTLAKMLLKATYDGWVDPRSHRVVPFGGSSEDESICLAILRNTLDNAPSGKRKRSAPKTISVGRGKGVADSEEEEEAAEEESQPLRRKPRTRTSVSAPIEEESSSATVSVSGSEEEPEEEASEEIEMLEIQEHTRPLQAILPAPGQSVSKELEAAEEESDEDGDVEAEEEPSSDSETGSSSTSKDEPSSEEEHDEEEEEHDEEEEDHDEEEEEQADSEEEDVQVAASILESCRSLNQESVKDQDASVAAASEGADVDAAVESTRKEDLATAEVSLQGQQEKEDGKGKESQEVAEVDTEDETDWDLADPAAGDTEKQSSKFVSTEDESAADPFSLSPLIFQAAEMARISKLSEQSSTLLVSSHAHVQGEPSQSAVDAASVPLDTASVGPKDLISQKEQEASVEGELSGRAQFDQTPARPSVGIQIEPYDSPLIIPDPTTAATPSAASQSVDVSAILTDLQLGLQDTRRLIQDLGGQISRIQESNQRFQASMMASLQEFFANPPTFQIIRFPNPANQSQPPPDS